MSIWIKLHIKEDCIAIADAIHKEENCPRI